MAKSVFGIARTEDLAIRIANDLRAAGFSDNDISVLFPDKQALVILLTNSIRKRRKVLCQA